LKRRTESAIESQRFRRPVGRRRGTPRRSVERFAIAGPSELDAEEPDMSKVKITSAQIRKKYLKSQREGKRGKKGRRSSKEPELDLKEKMSAVCEFFCRGYSVGEIPEQMLRKFGEAGRITREEPYRLLTLAAQHGWLRYHPPAHLECRERIRKSYPFLKEVEVVRTVMVDHVAAVAAERLLNIVRDVEKKNPEKKEIHIGFAGGHAMQLIAQGFAGLIAHPVEGLTKPLVIHALVSGFDPNRPQSDPNTYFTFFNHQKFWGGVDVRFEGLRFTSMIKDSDLAEARKSPEIERAFRAAESLDVVVTSGADWTHGGDVRRSEHADSLPNEHADSLLHEGMQRSRDSLETLKREGCRGDILWSPLGEKGPIKAPTELRAMSVIELSALPAFIARGGRVLLMLGPCCRCNQPKGALARMTLDLEVSLITDLVVDSRTGAEIVKGIGNGSNGNGERDRPGGEARREGGDLEPVASAAAARTSRRPRNGSASRPPKDRGNRARASHRAPRR
jgi:hypothetical protein